MNINIRQNSDFITESMANTLPGLFELRVKNTPQKIAYRQYDSERLTWQDFSWKKIYLEVSRWRQALQQEQLEKGDRVAVILCNSVEWVCFDQAAQSLGLVVVSLYTTDTAENITYILDDAGVRLLLVDRQATWQRLSTPCKSVTTLQCIWCLEKFEEPSSTKEKRFRFVADILSGAGSFCTYADISPNDTSTIIYTSGTTGRPKGVMLSHHNLLSNAEAVQKKIPAYTEDVFLSFLPLAHGFERTVEYILPMMANSCVAYARSISLLRDDLVMVRPTVFISAPRLYEKIYAAIQEKVTVSKLKKKLFDWAVSLGWQNFLAMQGRGPGLSAVKKLMLAILQSMVSSKVLAKLGGRLRVAVTGAAPLSPKVSRFFIGLGLPLLEGYGLTEAGPVVSGNSPADNVPGSVGRALPGIEVKIAGDGELLVRSPSVMQGYWQREKDTKHVIDKDGWLHTGDLAEIREDHIYIRGRTKEILVTSTGEKIAPADVESTIMLDPLFSQVMLVGEGKPYISALLVLNNDLWARFARHLQLDPDDDRSLSDEKAINAVLERLAGLLTMFPVYARVRAVNLSCKAWTIEDGLLTPTLKIKRHVLEERFANQIEQLYRGHVLIE